MTLITGRQGGVSLHQINFGKVVWGQKYHTNSKVYPDRSRVHKGAQVLVSQPVGLSFNQSVDSRLVGGSVSLSVGSSVVPLVIQSVRYYLQLTNIHVVYFLVCYWGVKSTYYPQVPKLLLANFSQSSTVIGAHPGPSRDVEQFGCLLKTLMAFCSWPPDSGEVRRTLQSGSLDFKIVSIWSFSSFH